MGASSFFEYSRGSNARSIFNYLVEEAEEEYGRRGYTGTIAEKRSEGFRIVSREPKSLRYWNSDEARRQYVEGEKWGPVLAAPYAEEVVKGSKDYTIKVSAKTRREAISLAKEAIANKGRSRAGTTVQVEIKTVNKVSDAGKPSIKKVPLRMSEFRVLYQRGTQSPFQGRTVYPNVTEAKRAVAEFAAKWVNGTNDFKPIGIIKTEAVTGYEVTASAKLPKWEITGTRKQVAMGRTIGWVFWGWASD